VEYGAVRAVLAGLQTLPVERALRVADHVGDLVYRVDHRHRAVAIENLSAAFPDLAATEVDDLARRVFRNLSRAAMELAQVPRSITATSWPRYLTFDRLDRYWRLAERGPALLVTGHIGNWELLGAALGVVGIESHAIARRLENPLLDRYCLAMRECRGQRIIYKEHALRCIGGLLRSGQNLAMMIDQDSGTRGVFCPFLGRLASTTALPAVLARRFRVPIIAGFCLRQGPGFRFRVLVCEPIFPEAYQQLPGPEAVARMTRTLSRQLEAVVRAHPEQWLWVHRRWKSRPPEESDAAVPAHRPAQASPLQPGGASESGARQQLRLPGGGRRAGGGALHPGPA
jgi:KDO2-lipid IV(A) lauroyltransferase